MNRAAQPTIPESFLEYKQVFATAWVDRWSDPNPFFTALYPLLQPSGIELADFSLPAYSSLGDAALQITLRQLNCIVRIGLDSLGFMAQNPSWQAVPELAKLIDAISSTARSIGGSTPKSQSATMTFHLTPGYLDFGAITSKLVNAAVSKNCLFCGVGLYGESHSLVIDRSVKFARAAFISLNRTFSGELLFSEIAAHLMEDQLAALRMLEISEIP